MTADELARLRAIVDPFNLDALRAVSDALAADSRSRHYSSDQVKFGSDTSHYIDTIAHLLPRLLAEHEVAIKDRDAATVALEVERNEHTKSLEHALEHAKATEKALHDAITMGNEARTVMARISANAETLIAAHNRTTPLVTAVEQWVRYRHNPGLLNAWDAYQDATRRSQ